MPDWFAHESAYVDDGATIGEGTKIWHFSHIMPGAVIGRRCSLVTLGKHDVSSHT